MLLIRLYHPADRSFDKFILTQDHVTTEEYMKLNLSLYIDPAMFIALLDLLLSPGELDRIRKSDSRHCGNATPSDFLKRHRFHALKINAQSYSLHGVGVEYNSAKGSGHVEVKYKLQSAGGAEKYFVMNFHIKRDHAADGKTLEKYLEIFFAQFSNNRTKIFEKIILLNQLTLRNFKSFGFKIAYRSTRYFLALMLTDVYLTHHAHLQHVKTKAWLFQTLLKECAWMQSNDEYVPDYRSVSAYQIKEAGIWSDQHIARGDYSFLPVCELGNFFEWGSFEEEYDDFGRGDTFFGTTPDPMEFVDARFVHVYFRKMDFGASTTFIRCDFYKANLYFARIYPAQMDLATLLTVRHAILNPTQEIEVQEAIQLKKAERETGLKRGNVARR